jgi:hypothetical protein
MRLAVVAMAGEVIGKTSPDPRKQQYLQGQGCSLAILGRIFNN